MGFAIAAGYSLTDELHQWFVPGRGASLLDCGIDTSGAGIGMLVIYLRHRLFTPKNDARAVQEIQATASKNAENKAKIPEK